MSGHQPVRPPPSGNTHEKEQLQDFASALREQNGRLEAELASFKELIEKDRTRLVQMTESLGRIEKENHEVTARFVALEQQKTEFANMFVTCYKLHSTLVRAEILNAMQEIVANLVGSEELVIFEAEEDGGALFAVHSFGVAPGKWRRVPVEQGRIGAALVGGDIFIVSPKTPVTAGEEQLTSVIPLRADGKIVGAIAIFRLLPQKHGYESLDKELLELLSDQGGIALRASGLAARAATHR